jgi:hypothetical protein
MSVGARLRHERPLHVGDALRQRRDQAPEVEPLIQRHLVVAAAAGVQLARERAADLAQLLLHPQVDVLGLRVVRHSVARRQLEHLRQPALQLRPLVGRQDAARGQHCHVREAALDVLFDHDPVEGQRAIDGVERRRGLTGKAITKHSRTPWRWRRTARPLA